MWHVVRVMGHRLPNRREIIGRRALASPARAFAHHPRHSRQRGPRVAGGRENASYWQDMLPAGLCGLPAPKRHRLLAAMRSASLGHSRRDLRAGDFGAGRRGVCFPPGVGIGPEHQAKPGCEANESRDGNDDGDQERSNHAGVLLPEKRTRQGRRAAERSQRVSREGAFVLKAIAVVLAAPGTNGPF